MMQKIRRLISFVCMVGVLFVSFIPSSFAVVELPEIDSPLTEPYVFYGIENGKKKVVVNMVLNERYSYDGPDFRLSTITAYSDINADFYLMLQNWTPQLTCTDEFTFNRVIYDVVTGSIYEESINQISYHGSSDQWALVYPPDHMYSGSFTSIGNFYFYPIKSDNLPYGKNSQNRPYDSSITNEYVNWSIIPPDPVVYKSYTSEPVSDPLNRYFIVAGEENQYLYWFNLRIAQFDVMRSKISSAEDPYYIYDYITQNNAYQPCVEYDTQGEANLTIKANDDYINWLLLYDGAGIYFTYDMLITKYDLKTGQYISSELHKDISGGIDSVDIESNLFDNINNFDSIQCFGVNFRNNSSYIVNRLACNWGIDPDFEVWKNNILSKLDDIYNALSGSEDSSTYPVNSDSSDAINDYQAAESELMQDFSDDLDNALSSGDGVFTSNNAYSFIRDTIQDLILNNGKLLVLVMFTLSFGLIVLVLGRRITR